MTSSDLLKSIRGAADVAGAIALRHYGNVDFSVKPDNSVITEADHEVERYLRMQLREIMPAADFIGEETARDAETVAAAAASEWVWVVDPIDGTAAFVDGLDTFGVCIGLLRDGEPFAGAVALPALGHNYSAVTGEGAWYDGRPIEVLHDEPGHDRAVICVSRNAHRYLDIDYAGKAHSFGTTALHFVLVARGAAVAAVARAHVWDHCASTAILDEAGGRVQHFDGTPIRWRELLDGREIWPPVLGTSPQLWDTIADSLYPRHEDSDL